MRAAISKSKIAIFPIFAVSFLTPQNGDLTYRSWGQERAINASFLAFDAGADSMLSEREYYSKLQAVDEATFKQDFEIYFLLLLDSKQKKAYESLQALDEKKAYIQHYWKSSNPNPLFPQNDWLLEFNRRIQYAKKHFRHPSPPYVDDRGRYYIKYGEPRRRFKDFGGDVRFDDDFRISYSTFPNETWSYENIQTNFVVYFVQDGVSYRRVRSPIEAVMDKGFMNQKAEYFILGDMIKKRETISLALFQAAAFIRAHADRRDPGLNISPLAALMTTAEELIFHNEVACIKAPSAARDPFQAENKLEFFDQVAQFRGPGDKTRIEVALLVPLKKNLIKKVKESSEDTLNVEFSGMLQDVNFESEVKNQSSSSLAVKLAAREKLPNAVGKFSLLARPQNAELTLQVEEKQREKTGYNRRPFQIRDFSSKAELMLSDIQLNYRVKNDVQKKILPALQHEDFPVCPYPYKEISKKKPPLVYFEIYNVQSAGIGESMQISYTIASKENKASVNVSFTRPVLSENMDELVEIDLKNVPKGWNLLKVSVSSLQDSTIKVVSQKKLFVKE
ncbi:MAG: GWxTD domain-containing protein [bacterium]